MNAKQVKEAKRGVAMLVFAEERAKRDFTHVPATPVDVKHAATLAKADAAIEGLGGKQAIQHAGEYGQKTDEKQGDRGDVEAMLRKINTNLAAIAEEKKQPEIMNRFRMPHGNGDTEAANKLTSFANAIDELELADELAAFNFKTTTGALRELAEALKDGGGEQKLALGKQSGATATIPELLKILRECKKTWDAIYLNTYEDNTEVLTTWRSVSHVPRGDGGKGKKDEPEKPDGPK